MIILPARAALKTGLTCPFLGSGGTAPYTYSLIKGGGSINASTGVYTSGAGTGTAIIRAKDSVGAYADAEIAILSPLGLFCDVLRTELDLDDEFVYLWDQKINKPKIDGLFIAVAEISCKPFSNIRRMMDNGNTFQATNFCSRLDVNIISRGNEARDRRAEVLMALNSFYAERQQALNSFRMYPITTSFVNLSEGDGAAIPYRYVLSCAINFAVEKTTVTPYFDSYEEPSLVLDNSLPPESAP